MKNTLAPLLVIVLLAGPTGLQAQPSARKSAPKSLRHGKNQAPVTITTRFGDRDGSVTIRFDTAVEDAVVAVRGLDGMTVDSATTAVGTSFQKGEKLTLDLTYTPGEGRSHLAVSVDGAFRGRRMSAVHTFAFGKPSAAQLKAKDKEVMVNSDGQRLRLLPAGKNNP